MTEPKIIKLAELESIEAKAECGEVWNTDTLSLIHTLRKSIEVNQFYASTQNYASEDKSLSTGNACYDILIFDFDRNLKNKKDFAGKRARDFMREVE